MDPVQAGRPDCSIFMHVPRHDKFILRYDGLHHMAINTKNAHGPRMDLEISHLD